MKLTIEKHQARKELFHAIAIGITIGGIISGSVVAILHNSEMWNIDPSLTLVFVLLFIPLSGYILSRVCFKAIE